MSKTKQKTNSDATSQKSELVNFLDMLEVENDSPFELVRLNENQTAVLFFTPDCVQVNIHYCEESEIRGYVHCNGTDCLLCRVGKKVYSRILIPVYLPTTNSIGILPVSDSLRPGALRPQIATILKSKDPMSTFIKREGSKYTVESHAFPDDANGGEGAIIVFSEDLKKGIFDISAVYQRIDNQLLANVPEIDKLMELKGIKKP